jgi:hypothetical protein
VQFCFCSHFPKDIFPFFLACRESLFVSGLICFLPSLVRVPRPCTNGTHQPESRRVRTTPHGPKLLGGGLHKTRAGLSLVSARRRRPLRRPASTRQVLPIDACCSLGGTGTAPLRSPGTTAKSCSFLSVPSSIGSRFLDRSRAVGRRFW